MNLRTNTHEHSEGIDKKIPLYKHPEAVQALLGIHVSHDPEIAERIEDLKKIEPSLQWPGVTEPIEQAYDRCAANDAKFSSEITELLAA